MEDSALVALILALFFAWVGCMALDCTGNGQVHLVLVVIFVLLVVYVVRSFR